MINLPIEPKATDTTVSTTENTNIGLVEENIDMDMPITVICKVQGHGEFSINSNDHLGNNPEQITYGCPKCGEAKSNYVIKSLSPNDKNINNYFDNSRDIVNNNSNSVIAKLHGFDFYKSNTFYVNPLISQDNICISEIDNITDKLLKIFPDTPSGLSKFDNLMSDSQIWSGNKVWSIEDYAICELDGYIIVFHLDLNNGLGTTINNIVPKNLVVMKQSFVPYQSI